MAAVQGVHTGHGSATTANGVNGVNGANTTNGANATNTNGNNAADSIPSRPAFELEEHPIDELRPIKVGVIGAGLSGVTTGVLLPPKLPGIDLRIYDKNSDVVCDLI